MSESVISHAIKAQDRRRIDELEARLKALEAQVRRLQEVMQ
jgi:hypothetical protein